jgi:hypothetical protein
MNAILGHELPQRPQGGAESDEIPEDSTSWAIIQQCWNFAPDQRPTCLEILPLLRSAFESDEEPMVDESDPSDDAPGTPPNSKFWEDMGKKGQGTIDFTEIYHLLLEVHYPYHKPSQCVVTHTHFYSGLAYQHLEYS